MIRTALPLLLLVATSLAQTDRTKTSKTTGPCSPAVSGNRNVFKIECSGISKDQYDQFLKILNTISRNEIPADKVIEKLDEIKNGVDTCTRVASPRRLSSQQKQLIASELATYRGQKLEIEAIIDPECSRYAQDLVDTLNSAGWKAVQRSSMMVNGPPPEGITVSVSKEDFDNQRIPAAFMALISTLEKAGIVLEKHWDPSVPSGNVAVFVGMKPSERAPN